LDGEGVEPPLVARRVDAAQVQVGREEIELHHHSGSLRVIVERAAGR
jgi:hypothetical protein